MNLMDLMIRIGVEDDASSGISSIVERTKSAANGIGNAIKTAVGVTTAAATAVGGYATAVGSAFEAQMSKVEAISGATADQMEQLTEKAKQMGIDTKFSATEAGQAFEYMAMAGWKTEQMLSGISGIMDLSAASGENLASVSDIVTDALTAFGLAAEDSSHFSDVLAAASSNSNTNVALMGETFKYVAPVAGALGFTIEDTATAIGTLANAGIKGSQAGTQLRQMFSRLSDATVKNKNYFQELTAEMGDTADTMDLMQKVAMLSGDGVSELETTLGLLGLTASNADGSMRSLNEILSDLKAAMRNLTQEEQAFAAKTIAGQEAMSGLLAIVNSADEEYNKLAVAIGNADGESKRMADTMINNLSGSFTMLKSSAEGFGLAVYEHIKEPLTGIVNVATESLNRITAAFSDGGVLGVFRMFADELERIAPDVATSFIGTIGDAVERIGALAGLNVTSAVDNIRAIGETVQAVQEAFVNGGLDGGLPAFIAEFAGLTGVDISGFVSGVEWLISTVSSAAPEILDSVGKGLQSILEPFREHGGEIISAYGSAIQSFLGIILDTDHSWIASVGEGIRRVMDPIVGAIPEVIENVRSGVESFLNVILGPDRSALASIGNSIVTIFSPITDAVAGALKTISQYFADIMSYAETSGFGDNLRKVADAATDLFANFTADLGGLISSAANGLAYLGGSITKDMIDDSERYGNALTTILNAIRNLASLGIGFVSDTIDAAVTSNEAYDRYMRSEISYSEYMAIASGASADIFGNAATRSQAFFNNQTEEQAWQDALEDDLDFNLFQRNNIQDMPNILPTLSNTNQQAYQIGRDIADGVNQGIADGLGSTAIGRSFDDLENEIRDINEINSPSKRYARIGRFMAEGVAVGWLDAFGKVKKEITNSMDFATGNVNYSDSAYGKLSTGIANSMLMTLEETAQTLSINVNLDGEVVARNQYDYLRGIAKQKGEAVNA